MYRQRNIIIVSDLDSWNECVAIVEDLNKLCAERGWAQGTLWTRTIGTFNELSLEFEYPDLATFQRETDEFIRDPATRDLNRRIDALRTEGTGYSELWEEAQPVIA